MGIVLVAACAARIAWFSKATSRSTCSRTNACAVAWAAASSGRLRQSRWRFFPSSYPRALRPSRTALSIYPLTELNCHLVWEVTRNAPGDDNHVARHDLCPLRQGATHLCHGPGQLGEAFGCATPRCAVRSDCRATVYPRVTVFLAGAVDE